MGLIVLSMFVVYLLVTAVLAGITSFVGRRKKIRWMKGRWVWLIMFLIPAWDMPIGSINFKRYCNSDEAGITVYRRVGLGDEFYLEKGTEIGRARFYADDEGGVTQRRNLASGDELIIKKVKVKFNVAALMHKKDITRWGYVDKFETVVRQDDEILGRAVSFRGGGGWFNDFVGSAGVGIVGFDCPKDAIGGYGLHSLKIYDQIFYRKSDGMSKGAENAYINK